MPLARTMLAPCLLAIIQVLVGLASVDRGQKGRHLIPWSTEACFPARQSRVKPSCEFRRGTLSHAHTTVPSVFGEEANANAQTDSRLTFTPRSTMGKKSEWKQRNDRGDAVRRAENAKTPCWDLSSSRPCSVPAPCREPERARQGCSCQRSCEENTQGVRVNDAGGESVGEGKNEGEKEVWKEVNGAGRVVREKRVRKAPARYRRTLCPT